MDIDGLQTPALLVERALLQANLDTMTAALPGARLRPHIKAHKTTALARAQQANGHHSFTCATIREMEGMARAGLGDDLLLANEVARRPPARRPGRSRSPDHRRRRLARRPLRPRPTAGSPKSWSTSTSACPVAVARRPRPGGSPIWRVAAGWPCAG
ncbi:MAG: alanine racemase [Geodermatophilaceae bacterium]